MWLILAPERVFFWSPFYVCKHKLLINRLLPDTLTSPTDLEGVGVHVHKAGCAELNNVLPRGNKPAGGSECGPPLLGLGHQGVNLRAVDATLGPADAACGGPAAHLAGSR